MKNLAINRERMLAIALAICLACLLPAAHAVVKNVSIVDGDGNALANTKVTITFPNGDTVEEETDDDGTLIYDFPEDGDYTIDYPGGSMAVSVSGGIPTWVWVAGGVAAAGITYAIVDDDDDSSSSSGDSSSGGSGSGGSSTGGTCVDDTFNIVVQSVISNPGGHPTDDIEGMWEHFCSDGLVTIVQQSGTLNAPWECLIGTDGSCNVGPTICSIGGNTTTCSLDSTIIDFDWSGTMIGGLDGMLPGGQPVELTFGHP